MNIGPMESAEHVDLAIVGAGAAGLMAAIFAGRTIADSPPPGGRRPRVVALDGARTLGAKILVAGGGRCNVTHDVVDPREYAGSSTNAIRKVLLRFDVAQTVAFFAELGVELKREETGKLFPVTDDARTVLNALLRAGAAVDAELRHPWRVDKVEVVDAPDDEAAPRAATQEMTTPRFLIRRTATSHGGLDAIAARRVVLAPGGRALPRSGSDGSGHEIARHLGHTITEAVFPALVPLVIDPSSDPVGIRDLAGVSVVATLEVRSGTGKRLKAITGSTLCTHFGLSGPGPMDISRYLTDARRSDQRARLQICLLPGVAMDTLDAELTHLGQRSVGRFLRRHPTLGRGHQLPERLVTALCRYAGVDPEAAGHTVRREPRRELARAVTELVVPIAGDRGWNAAETTAGGVPLAEIDLKTMESRIVPGLHLCGEICDVDGRIGGYNFQWAWASGFVAGSSAARALLDEPAPE